MALSLDTEVTEAWDSDREETILHTGCRTSLGCQVKWLSLVAISQNEKEQVAGLILWLWFSQAKPDLEAISC